MSGDEGPKTSVPLSPAERHVLLGVLDGKTNAQMAAERGTSIHTVGNQVSSVFRKMGVSTRATLAAHPDVECLVPVPEKEILGFASPTIALSERDLTIMEGVADGMKNRDIADQLGVSVSTVALAIQRFGRRIGVRRRTGIVRWVRSRRKVSP